MTESNGERYSVTCPHCHKEFVGELLTGDAQRYRGFKCPHCKLFVPADRTGEPVVPPLAPSFDENR